MGSASPKGRVRHRTQGLGSDTTISLKITDDLNDRLTREAERVGCSKSELIRWSVEQELTDPSYDLDHEGDTSG